MDDGAAGDNGSTSDLTQTPPSPSQPFLLPLAIDLQGRRCLCVGGGSVVARRIDAMLAAGGQVTVVAPTLHPSVADLAARGVVAHQARVFEPGDARGAFLVLAATGDPAVDREVAAEALANSALVSVASEGGLGTCRFMATVRRGSVVVGIHTGGAAPAVSAALRARLERELPDQLAIVVDELGALREELRQMIVDAPERAARWDAAVASGDLDAALSGDPEAIARIRSRLREGF